MDKVILNNFMELLEVVALENFEKLTKVIKVAEFKKAVKTGEPFKKAVKTGFKKPVNGLRFTPRKLPGHGRMIHYTNVKNSFKRAQKMKSRKGIRK